MRSAGTPTRLTSTSGFPPARVAVSAIRSQAPGAERKLIGVVAPGGSSNARGILQRTRLEFGTNHPGVIHPRLPQTAPEPLDGRLLDREQRRVGPGLDGERISHDENGGTRRCPTHELPQPLERPLAAGEGVFLFGRRAGRQCQQT